MNQGIYPIGNATIASVPYGVNGIPFPTTIKALVIGGGGGAGGGVFSGSPNYRGAPGGAGGFIESLFIISLGTDYTISIGAGGAASGATGLKGTDSSFATFTAVGGGGGGGFYYSANGNTPSYWNSSMGGIGGSGGGAGITGGMLVANSTGGRAILGQGNVGGSGFYSATGPVLFVGGGGGAGSAGSSASVSGHGAAGAGKVSTINNRTYSTGGGVNSGTGTANSGNGGGTASTNSSTNGGSGVVVLQFANSLNIKLGVGLTYTSITSGSDRIITITAGTDTVTFF